jgi:hypothetical protein
VIGANQKLKCPGAGGGKSLSRTRGPIYGLVSSIDLEDEGQFILVMSKNKLAKILLLFFSLTN